MINDGYVLTINVFGEVVGGFVFRESPDQSGRLDLLIPYNTGESVAGSKGQKLPGTKIGFYLSEKCRHEKEYVFVGEDPEILREFSRRSLNPETIDETSDVSDGNKGDNEV